MKLEFSRRIFEKCSNIKFHKIHPVGAQLFNEDGRTGGRHGEANIRFRNFANAPKNVLQYCSACGNYTCCNNFIKLMLHCLIKKIVLLF